LKSTIKRTKYGCQQLLSDDGMDDYDVPEESVGKLKEIVASWCGLEDGEEFDQNTAALIFQDHLLTVKMGSESVQSKGGGYQWKCVKRDQP